MKPETLQALKESIEHWERLASGHRFPNERVSRQDCALCMLFNSFKASGDDACKGCPVYEVTGFRFCNFTPYCDAYRHRFDLNSPEFQAAAKKELNFLKSLLLKRKCRQRRNCC